MIFHDPAASCMHFCGQKEAAVNIFAVTMIL
jgi:hypothetical protein